MWQNVYQQSPDGYREIFFKYYVVFRILDKLHIFSNILCTCSFFIKMWAQIQSLSTLQLICYLSI